ncbi:unnamed protein product [Phaedon cochleariae]|uniref:Major facilitator superfamily (MFS) profile domain-containing protein n=1 Tax=Phaedon cochleariae TaxID=80249 RepID=A0A9N9SHI6_PHACE|nr:unnamed protein product [Phaedon cochleariae]
MEVETSAAPDGGWGWMVVFGAALINMVNQAMFANFGLIFGEQLKVMANGHATGITVVLAINVVVTNFAGLLVGPCLKKISLRSLTFISIALVGSGMILSSFATEIWHVVVGYSFFTGLGLGLLASGTFLVINDYFTTKKSTAVGISMAGTAMGQMLMPTFIGMLLKKYEYSGTTFILGFVSFTGVIGAMFFKPIFCCKKCAVVQPDQEKGKDGEMTSEKKESILEKEGEKLLAQNGGRLKKQGILKRTIEKNYSDSALEVGSSQYTLEEDKPTKLDKISKSLGLDLLKDGTFVHIVTGLGLVYVSSYTFNAFLPMFLQDEAEFSMLETTTCMTALSTADVIGRVTVPEISRRLRLSNKRSFMIGCILLAITRSCLVELGVFQYTAAFSIVVGYFRAAAVINQNLVISEYISKEKLPSAVGLNMVVKALLSLTLGQSLGLLKDQLSYSISIHVLNVIVLGVVLSWFFETMVRRIRSSRKPKPICTIAEETNPKT